MKANELRIGNLLYYKNTVDVAMVEIIHKKHFDCRDKYGTFTPNGRYEPIPLTEEWLLKLGFNKTYSLNYEGRIMALPVIARIFTGGVYIETGGIYLGDRVNYVHEYQNLYFALCGKELEVTP